jgi:uncharacterized membrane protein
MEILQGAVQWLHVLGAIFWFGGTLFMNFVIIPGIRTISVGAQQEFGAAVGKTSRIIQPVAYTTIALGILRGTVFGPVKSADFLFGTAYGITWLVALVVAVGLILYAQLVLDPFRERLQHATPEQASAIIRQAGALFATELLGFFVVFTAMILMRFGL